MESLADLDEEAWNAEFLRALRRGLAASEDQGQLLVERADVAAGEVITILRFADAGPRWRGQGPARPPTSRGRVVSFRWLREMLLPATLDHVAGSWIESLYSPDHPDPATLVEGVHWFRDRTPGMHPDEIDRLGPALRPAPPPRWRDDPPGVNPNDVYFTGTREPATPRPEPPPHAI